MMLRVKVPQRKMQDLLPSLAVGAFITYTFGWAGALFVAVCLFGLVYDSSKNRNST